MTLHQLNLAALKIAKKYPLRYTYQIEVTGFSVLNPVTKKFESCFSILFTNEKVKTTVFNSMEATEKEALAGFEQKLKIWALDFKVCPQCNKPFKPLLQSRIYCNDACCSAAQRSRKREHNEASTI